MWTCRAQSRTGSRTSAGERPSPYSVGSKQPNTSNPISAPPGFVIKYVIFMKQILPPPRCPSSPGYLIYLFLRDSDSEHQACSKGHSPIFF